MARPVFVTISDTYLPYPFTLYACMYVDSWRRRKGAGGRRVSSQEPTHPLEVDVGGEAFCERDPASHSSTDGGEGLLLAPPPFLSFLPPVRGRSGGGEMGVYEEERKEVRKASS